MKKKDVENPVKKTKQRKDTIKTFNHLLDNVEKWAEIIKSALQIIIGILIIGYIGYHTFTTDFHSATDFTNSILRTVAIGLILSTAIELSYMLFTHGPDEAIDPIITALAAILLLRMPAPINLESDISFSRIVELLVYGIIIAILFTIREMYLNGELKRK